MKLYSNYQCDTEKMVVTRETFTRGGKVVIALLLIEYIAPFFLVLLFDVKPHYKMPIDSTKAVVGFFVLIFTAFLAVLAAKVTPNILPRRTNIKPLPKGLLITLSFLGITSGIYLINAGMLQWRYEAALSSAGGSMMAISTLQYLLPLVGFWILLTDHKLLLSMKTKDVLLKIAFIFAILLTMNGLGGFLKTSFLAFVFFMPNTALRVLHGKSFSTNKKTNVWKAVGIFIVAPIAIAGFFILAIFSKSGRETPFEDAALTYLATNYLIGRHAVHMAISLASIEEGADYRLLEGPVQVLFYRLQTLTSIDMNIERPTNGSMPRITIVKFADYKGVTEREGTSPGILANITMILPFHLSVLAVFIFFFVLIKALDSIWCRQPPLTWLGAFFFAYFPLRLVTDSPTDLLIPSEDALILMFFLLAAINRTAGSTSQT